MEDATYVRARYEQGKADLYAAFLQRGLDLVQNGGVAALLTMRNWMFIRQFSGLRIWLLTTHDLRALGDFDRGGFEAIPDEVVSVVVSVTRRSAPTGVSSISLQPTPLEDRTRDSARTARKRASTLCQVGLYKFVSLALKAVPEWPLVYWWSEDALKIYAKMEKIKDRNQARLGCRTSNNDRSRPPLRSSLPFSGSWPCASSCHASLALPLAPRTPPISPGRALPAAHLAAPYSPARPNSHLKTLSA